MKDLTRQQAKRIDDAATRIDNLVDSRPVIVRDEIEVSAIV